MQRAILIAASLTAALALSACADDGGSGATVVLQGQASQAALDAINGASISTDATKGPAVTVPTEGQAYQPSDAPPPFRWTSPLTGAVYRLTFTIPGEGTVIVATTDTSYTPDATIWGQMKGASGRIMLEIVGASMNAAAISDGPYKQATPRSFGIAATFW